MELCKVCGAEMEYESTGDGGRMICWVCAGTQLVKRWAELRSQQERGDDGWAWLGLAKGEPTFGAAAGQSTTRVLGETSMATDIPSKMVDKDDETGRLLTMHEVADWLRLNPQTVRRMILNRQIEGFKAGGQYRITEESVKRLIASAKS